MQTDTDQLDIHTMTDLDRHTLGPRLALRQICGQHRERTLKLPKVISGDISMAAR